MDFVNNTGYKRLFLFFFSTFTVTVCFGQTYKVGDKVKISKDSLFRSKCLEQKEFVINITEKKYRLVLNKKNVIEIINSYLNDAIQEKDFKNEGVYKKCLDYLKESDDISFKNIWSNTRNTEDVSIFNDKPLGVTIRTIKDIACPLIEKGDFCMYVRGEKVDYYYFDYVDTSLGNANCVFSNEGLLFWICPPIIVD